MINKDDTLLGEAYGQMHEGMFDRMKAKAGTVGQNLGSKAIGGVGKLVGGQAGETLQQASGQMKGAVDAKRTAQLVTAYMQKIGGLVEQLKKDGQAMGLDLEKLAQNPNLAQTDPALMGLTGVFGALKSAQTLASKATAGQAAPAQAPAPDAGTTTGTM